jgi:hypothetical protein
MSDDFEVDDDPQEEMELTVNENSSSNGKRKRRTSSEKHSRLSSRASSQQSPQSHEDYDSSPFSAEERKREKDRMNKRVMRMKQRQLESRQSHSIAILGDKKARLIGDIMKLKASFPDKTLPQFIPHPDPEEVEKDRVPIALLSEKEKLNQRRHLDRLIKAYKLKKEKIGNHNRATNILFLERQVKYLEAILKVLTNTEKKPHQVVMMEYEVLKRVLLTPIHQTPGPLPAPAFGRGKKKSARTTSTDQE